MRLLYVGDVVGRSGRKIALEELPRLRDRFVLDAVIVNGENAAGGYGITPSICQEFYDAGTDVITTGNHVFDQREIIPHLERDVRLLRPLNMMPGTPGRGVAELRLPDGRNLLVAQIMGRLFMGQYDDPFRAIEAILARYRLGANASAIVVDVHAEATSEKMAMGHFLDGRASLVVGTHTHIPTADAQILSGGTAYISDVGMTGDYDSVIGMVKDVSLTRFRSHLPGTRNTPALGDPTLCAVLVETDDASGLARRIDPVRIGGRLAPASPDVG